MMTISKIVGMISFVREKFVQNLVRTVKNVREEIVVHVSSQLQWRSQKFSTGVRQSVAILSVHSRSAALPSRPYSQKTS